MVIKASKKKAKNEKRISFNFNEAETNITRVIKIIAKIKYHQGNQDFLIINS